MVILLAEFQGGGADHHMAKDGEYVRGHEGPDHAMFYHNTALLHMGQKLKSPRC
jgi:hypothetical protein